MGKRQIEAGGAFVKIVLRNQVGEGLKTVGKQVQAFGATVARFGGLLAAGSAAVVTPILSAVAAFAHWGDSLGDMATRTGLSVRALSALGFAAELCGTNLEGVEAGVKKWNDTLANAIRGDKAATAALDRLGLSAAELEGIPVDEQLAAIADRLAAIDNPALRVSAALDVLGKNGAALLPLMADGGDGLRRMAAEAERLGLTLDDDAAAAAGRLDDSFVGLKSAARGVWIQLGAALAPVVAGIAENLRDVIARANFWIRANRGVIIAAAGAAVAVGALGVGLVVVGAALSLAGRSAGQLGKVFGVAGRVVAGAMSGATKPLAALAGVGRAASRSWANAMALMSRVRATGGAIGDVLAGAFAKVGAAGGQVGGVAARGLGRLSAAAGRCVATIGAGGARGVVGALSAIGRAASNPAAGANAMRSLASAGRAAGSAIAGAAVSFARGWSGELGLVAANSSRAFWRIGDAARSAVALGMNPGQWSGAARGAVTAAAVTIRTTFDNTWKRIATFGPGALRAAFVATRGAASSAAAAVRAAWLANVRPIAAAIQRNLGAAWRATVAAGIAGFAKLRAAGVIMGRSVARATGTIGRGIGAAVGGVANAAGTLGELAGGTIMAPIVAAAGVAATVLGALGPIVAGLATPFGVVAAVVGVAIAAWVKWSKSGQQAGQAVADIFGPVVQIVGGALRGMRDALAAGDLVGAARIAWLGILAAFESGVSAARAKWPGLFAGIDRLFDIIAGVRAAFAKMGTDAGGVWEFIGNAAAGLGEWIAGIWAALPAAITGPLENMAAAFGAWGAWIGDQFAALWDWAKETFRGIADALAAGELGLAASIAWVSVRQAWAAGVDWITRIWSETTTGLAGMFDALATNIQGIWGNVVNWIAEKLTALTGAIADALNAIAEFDPTGLAAELAQSLTVDVDAAIAALREDRARAEREAARALAQRDTERGAALQAQAKAADERLAALAAERAALLGQAAQLREQQGNGGAGPKIGDQKVLADRLAALAAATGDAARKRAEFDAAAAAKQARDAAGEGDTLAGAGTSGPRSAGTFSAAAAGGLIAGGVNAAELKATLDSAEHLRQILAAIRAGKPLVFRGAGR